MKLLWHKKHNIISFIFQYAYVYISMVGTCIEIFIDTIKMLKILSEFKKNSMQIIKTYCKMFFFIRTMKDLMTG